MTMIEAYSSLIEYHTSRAAHFFDMLKMDANNVDIFNNYTYHLFKVEEMRRNMKKEM